MFIPKSQHMRILIVEDEPGVASFVARGLNEAGHKPEIATTGDGGLTLALDNDYDTLVLDLILPGMTGLEVCRRYREAKGFETPIIMLTALGSTEDIVAGLKVGADDYLVKPFKFKELLARIEALSRGRQQQATPEKLISADLEVDLYRRMVSRGGQSIRLTARRRRPGARAARCWTARRPCG